MNKNESSVTKIDWLFALVMSGYVLAILFLVTTFVIMVNHGVNLIRSKHEAEIAAVPISSLKDMISDCQVANVRFTNSELKNLTYEEVWKHRDRCQSIATNIRKEKEIDAIAP